MDENINNKISFFRKNLWNILSVSIGIIGISLAIFFGFKGLKLKLPYYSIQNENLISDSISKINLLDIKFEGNKIDNLTVSKLAFWNAGKETINGIDIAKADPLTVQLIEKAELLGDPIILFPLNSPNQFSINVSQDKKSFYINFDFIEKDEGIIIKFFHTGKRDDDIIIKGTIKGVGGISKVSIPQFIKFGKGERIVFFIILFGSPVAMLFYLFLGKNETGHQKSMSNLLALFYLIVFIFLAYFYYDYITKPNIIDFLKKELIK